MNKMGQVLLAGALLAAAGCAIVGRDFPVEPVQKIVSGTTTRDEVRAAFGEPYQASVDNGRESWTYYHARYRGKKLVRSKELRVLFDTRGIVENHAFAGAAR